MSAVHRLRAMLRRAFRRTTIEREMDAEFRSHIAHRADDLERQGMPRDAAERAAQVEFGAMEAQKDAARDMRGWGVMGELRANVAFGLRGARDGIRS